VVAGGDAGVLAALEVDAVAAHFLMRRVIVACWIERKDATSLEGGVGILGRSLVK
jgi:hypothetical protein